MCYVEHVCYTPCGHWNDRITATGACPKVKSVGGVQVPCSQTIRIGMANDDGACRMCSRRPNRCHLQVNQHVEFNESYLDPLPSPKPPVYGIVDDFPSRYEAPREPLRRIKEVDAKNNGPGLESSPLPNHKLRSTAPWTKLTTSRVRYHITDSSITITKMQCNLTGGHTVHSERLAALGAFERGTVALLTVSKFEDLIGRKSAGGKQGWSQSTINILRLLVKRYVWDGTLTVES
jgi:hypothetical protein